MARFRRIVFCAVLAGVIGGALFALLQTQWVAPLILEAEVYEDRAAAGAIAAGDHAHDNDAWSPEAGFERTALTWLTTILTAVAYALLLVSGYAVVGNIDWRKGLLWGAAGYGAVMLSPALGLPPELPGAAAAGLEARQGWWLGTVLATAAGFGLIAYGRRIRWAIVGIVLIVLPHVIGAPQPADHGGVAPDGLAREFVIAVLATGLVFWVALGGLSGFLFRRLVGGAAPAAG